MIRKLLTRLFPPKCAHLRVRESMACDAWCQDCGLNLGFIGTWREASKRNPRAMEIPNDPRDQRSWNPTPDNNRGRHG